MLGQHVFLTVVVNRHLPLHCRIYLAEVDLKKVVTTATLAVFKERLLRRSRHRKKVEREDIKRSAKVRPAT